MLHGERRLNMPPYGANGYGREFAQRFKDGLPIVWGSSDGGRFLPPRSADLSRRDRPSRFVSLSPGWSGVVGIDGKELERFTFPVSPQVVLTGERRITLRDSALGANEYVEQWEGGKIVSAFLEYREIKTGKTIRTPLPSIGSKGASKKDSAPE